MSQLSSVSGKVGREVERLRMLNDALLTLEADGLGQNSTLKITSEDVARSRQVLVDFAERLCSILRQGSTSTDLLPVIRHFRSGSKPVGDWIEDLEKLIRQIRGNKITSETIFILEEILSLLDDQFTEDLRRIYVR